MVFETTEAAAAPALAKAVCRVAAGAIAKKLLAQEGIRVLGYVKQVGDVVADLADPSAVTLDQVESNAVRCPDASAAERMIALIEQVRKEQDSIGGICELVATGVPPGLGEPVFDKLKADLAKGLLSLPAVTAFEYGAGFGVAQARGSANNDAFIPKGSGGIGTQTNRHGGMLGGNQQRRADRLPSSRQANQQPAAAAADRHALRRTHRDCNPRPPRPLPAAALRPDGRSNGGAGAGRSLVALAGPVWAIRKRREPVIHSNRLSASDGVVRTLQRSCAAPSG